jgi:guanylate kinase
VAAKEIKRYREYDYVIVNNILEDALKELSAIIITKRVSTERVDPQLIEMKFFKK